MELVERVVQCKCVCTGASCSSVPRRLLVTPRLRTNRTAQDGSRRDSRHDSSDDSSDDSRVRASRDAFSKAPLHATWDASCVVTSHRVAAMQERRTPSAGERKSNTSTPTAPDPCCCVFLRAVICKRRHAATSNPRASTMTTPTLASASACSAHHNRSCTPSRMDGMGRMGA